MKLRDFQQNVLNSLKERPVSQQGHPYFSELKDSHAFRLTHRTVVYWRINQISRLCVLTTRYLQAKGILQETVLQLYKRFAMSNFADEVSFFFLDQMAESDDNVLASVATFERANLGRRFGKQTPAVTEWDFEPTAILYALMKNDYTTACLQPGRFVTEVSVDSASGFELYTAEEWDNR